MLRALLRTLDRLISAPLPGPIDRLLDRLIPARPRCRGLAEKPGLDTSRYHGLLPPAFDRPAPMLSDPRHDTYAFEPEDDEPVHADPVHYEFERACEVRDPDALDPAIRSLDRLINRANADWFGRHAPGRVVLAGYSLAIFAEPDDRGAIRSCWRLTARFVARPAPAHPAIYPRADFAALPEGLGLPAPDFAPTPIDCLPAPVESRACTAGLAS